MNGRILSQSTVLPPVGRQCTPTPAALSGVTGTPHVTGLLARPPRLSSNRQPAWPTGLRPVRQAWCAVKLSRHRTVFSGLTTWLTTPYFCRLFNQLPAQNSVPVLDSKAAGSHRKEQRGTTRSTTFSSYHSCTRHCVRCSDQASHHGTLSVLPVLHSRSVYKERVRQLRAAGNREPLAHCSTSAPISPWSWILDSSMRNKHTALSTDIVCSPDSPVGPSWVPTNPLSPCSCTYMTRVIHLRIVYFSDWLGRGTF